MPSIRDLSHIVIIDEVKHDILSDGQGPTYIDIGNPAKTSHERPIARRSR